jgi:mediator of RNA polymerase II transcription subunit 6
MGQEGVHWSPASGHTYFPPSYETTKTAGSAAASRAGSIAPGGVDMDTSQASVTQPSEEQTTEFSDAFFLQSLQLTNQYGNEYMDENPLQGEPGSFVFASTKQQVEARNKAAAAQAALAVPAKPDDSQSVVSSSVAPTPKPLPTEASSRKGSIASIPPKAKKERRKSKGLASPISPTGPS